MDTAIRDAILPAIEARRQKIIDMDAQMARVGVETPAEGSNHAMTRVIVSVDGEQDMFMSLEAALQEVLAAQPAPGAGRSAEGIKWAGGCSLVQQPCDVSRCFPMLTVEMKRPVVDSHPPLERWLSGMLSELEPASQWVYSNFLKALPARLFAAFTARLMDGDWRVRGVYPLNHRPFCNDVQHGNISRSGNAKRSLQRYRIYGPMQCNTEKFPMRSCSWLCRGMSWTLKNG